MIYYRLSKIWIKDVIGAKSPLIGRKIPLFVIYLLIMTRIDDYM